jgi:hypothetical protein
MLCRCIDDIEKQQVIKDYAEQVVCDAIDTFEGLCPEMIAFAVEQIVARLVHVTVLSYDETLYLQETKTINAVAKHIDKMSRTTPAALHQIIQESKEGGPSARN